MRLLHVITSLHKGGAESHLADLARWQARHGHEVTVASLKGDDYWAAPLRQAGVAVVSLGLTGAYGHPAPALRLRRLVRQARPDLVHAHLEPAELYTRLALLGVPRRALPVVISKHNDTKFWDSAGRSLTWVARWIAARADRVIAISEAVRRYYVEGEVGLAPDAVSVVPYGFERPLDPSDAERAAELRSRLTAGDASVRLVGTVARLVRQKALHVQIEALARLDPSVHLVVVGEGPLASDLRALASRLGVGHRVHFEGFQTDIPAYMRAFDVFALSSIYEGFGLVLLEAMAAARPIVATRVSAIPEVVADGETGLLVPPNDVAAFASALSRVLACPDALGVRGRERLTSRYSVDAMGHATDRIYLSLRRSHARRP